MINIVFWFTEDAITMNADTQACVAKLRDKYHIQYRLTTLYKNDSPWEVLREFWGRDDLILIDQDIVFTEAQLKELIDCPESGCAFWYVVAPYVVGPGRVIGPPFVSVWEPRMHTTETVKGVTHSAKASLGFGKISKALQSKPIEWFDVANAEKDGKGIDNAIIENTGYNNWHIHGQVEHNHRVFHSWYKEAK